MRLRRGLVVRSPVAGMKPIRLGATFILAAVHTGAREGELLELEWGDVDFEERTMSICKSDCWARTTAERAERTVVGLRGPVALADTPRASAAARAPARHRWRWCACPPPSSAETLWPACRWPR